MEWTEIELIESCKKHDEQGQMALFHKYKKKFLTICLRYVYDKRIAEELLMDSFITIYQKIDLYKEKSFEGWMKTIVIHKAIDYYRKHKKDPVFTNVEEKSYEIAIKTTENNLEAEELMRILTHLPSGYRMVFNMHAIEGYTHSEIAKKLSISVNTSKTQLHKAKRKLQEMLEKGGYNG